MRALVKLKGGGTREYPLRFHRDEDMYLGDFDSHDILASAMYEGSTDRWMVDVGDQSDYERGEPIGGQAIPETKGEQAHLKEVTGKTIRVQPRVGKRSPKKPAKRTRATVKSGRSQLRRCIRRDC